MAIINGTNASETLNGTVNNDTIKGFAGNDTIFGDTGRDIVDGGNGDDRFDITAQAQIVAGETYIGGLGNTDRLFLNTTSLIDLSTVVIGTDVEQLVANGSVSLRSAQLGNFIYIQTGAITLTNGGLVDLTNATVFTTVFTLNNAGNIFDLTGVTSTSYTVNGADGADTIIGGEHGDTLNGGGKDDTIFGGGGNDIIFGGTGRDIVNGGNGNDRFDITAQSEIVASETYIGGLGTDRLNLNTTSLIDLSTVIIGTDVEELVASGSISLKSSQLGNFDYVQTGAITLTNGGLVDLTNATVFTTSFTLNNAGNTFNLSGLANAFSSYTVNGADGVDIITGGENFDTLNGGSGDDTLNGGGKEDTLTGGAGKDTIIGGAGNDRMIITAQADIVLGETYNGGTGLDKLDLETASSIDISPIAINADIEQIESSGAVSLRSGQLNNFIHVNTGAIVLTNGGVVDLTDATVFTNTFDLNAAGNTLNLGGVNDTSHTVNGAGGNDTITGGDFFDTIRGGAGNDTMVSSPGADRFEGGVGIDTANYSTEVASVEVTLDGSALVTVVIGGINVDTIQDVESVVGGNANDILTGDSLANSLSGGGGNDLLNGVGGNDLLNGRSGNDTMNGGVGNDLMIGGFGRDNMNGNAGFDRFDYDFPGESLLGAVNRDVITGFVGNGASAGDLIDVSTIDANVTLAGNQAFSFIGNAAFSAPGQLRYVGGILQGNTNANAATAEFEIQLAGSPVLVGADIIL